jgi:hypothetical protein
MAKLMSKTAPELIYLRLENGRRVLVIRKFNLSTSVFSRTKVEGGGGGEEGGIVAKKKELEALFSFVLKERDRGPYRKCAIVTIAWIKWHRMRHSTFWVADVSGLDTDVL